jgi:hypothetical protein
MSGGRERGREVHGIIFIRMRQNEIGGTEALRLRRVVQGYMASCDGLQAHCTRCLATQRWGGSVTLMVVDAAFMSIGLNYFTAVVPAVAEYEVWMQEGRAPSTLEEMAKLSYDTLAPLWKNRRSWHLAREVAACLLRGDANDAHALRSWAATAPLEAWKQDPVGAIKGVGINTYQYLRMMGGVDTSMPDKIVRRVIAAIVLEAEVTLPTTDDIELIKTIDAISRISGYRPIELCWMTWMIQSEGKTMRMDKYRDLLQRI